MYVLMHPYNYGKIIYGCIKTYIGYNDFLNLDQSHPCRPKSPHPTVRLFFHKKRAQVWRARHGLSPHFREGHGGSNFYITLIEDKSSEKPSFALNGHGIVKNDPTIKLSN